eukprot:TRINITY_DN79_c0_g2_i4.p2 TRINITY_DN79_c0_g2~~TRINITY_DN79_c0_g2_i4.p2  ORF type:complete len:102 (-),score=34.36 TRINITY_DN79_c0_g2_i4:27-332(-)
MGAMILSRKVIRAILKPKRKRKRKGPKHINAKVAKPKKARKRRGRPRKIKNKDTNLPASAKQSEPVKGTWGKFVKQARKNLGEAGKTSLKKEKVPTAWPLV